MTRFHDFRTLANAWIRSVAGAGWIGLLFLASCSQNIEELDSDKPVPPPPRPLAEQLGRRPQTASEGAAAPGTTAMPGSAQQGMEQGVDRGIPPGITGEVRLTPEFADRVEPGAVLYIIARKPGGPPVAARRIDHPTFPVRFFLGQESIMFEGQGLEGQIDLSARIAQHGVAGPAEPGDLSGQCPDNPITIGNSTVFTITLDTLH